MTKQDKKVEESSHEQRKMDNYSNLLHFIFCLLVSATYFRLWE